MGDNGPMSVSVSRHIHAPAEKVFDLVADMPRMGEWSPENTGGTWQGGATGPSVGAKFKGTNAAGKHRWSTTVTVVECERPSRFAFEVTSGPVKVARWAYAIAPTAEGCEVTESWVERRPALVRRIFDMGSKVKDRSEHNRTNMATTLERLAATAEAAG